MVPSASRWTPLFTVVLLPVCYLDRHKPTESEAAETTTIREITPSRHDLEPGHMSRSHDTEVPPIKRRDRVLLQPLGQRDQAGVGPTER